MYYVCTKLINIIYKNCKPATFRTITSVVLWVQTSLNVTLLHWGELIPTFRLKTAPSSSTVSGQFSFGPLTAVGQHATVFPNTVHRTPNNKPSHPTRCPSPNSHLTRRNDKLNTLQITCFFNPCRALKIKSLTTFLQPNVTQSPYSRFAAKSLQSSLLMIKIDTSDDRSADKTYNPQSLSFCKSLFLLQ